MSVFSPEKQARCGLPDTPEITPLPEMQPCLIGEIPVLELQPDIFPVDGTDGCTAVDGQDAQDARDGEPGADGCDAVDGQDAQDAVDGEPGADGCDAVDGQDAQDAIDGEPGTDGCDAVDGQDAQDAIDGEPGTDGCDAVDGQDAQDGAEGEPGEQGEDGCDAVDGQDAQDAIDGEPGADGCDAVDGQDSQDAIDGEPGTDGCDAVDGQDAQDGSDGVPGEQGEPGVQPYIVTPLTRVPKESTTTPYPFRVKCLKRRNGNTWEVVECETTDGSPQISAFNPSGSDLSPSKNYLAAKDNDDNWIILSGAGEGGSGEIAARIEATIVLPVSCPIAFYKCEPAPQERPIDNTSKLPDETLPFRPTDNGFSAGFFAAKCMGLLKRDNVEYNPVPAYFAATQTVDVFEWRVVDPDSPMPELPADCVGGYWEMVHSYPFNLGSLWFLHGRKQPALTGDKMYADPQTKTVPLYRRRLEVKPSNGIALIEPCSVNESHGGGWVQLKYIEGGPEIVEVPPPLLPPGWAFVEYDIAGNVLMRKRFVKPRITEDEEPEILDEFITIPRQGLDFSAGIESFVSCNITTGYCTYIFAPTDYPYDSRVDFPFWFGLTPAHEWSLTSNANDAQLDYEPCLCDYLDRNERLIPGQKLEYSKQTTNLVYELPDTLDGAGGTAEVEFGYYAVIPPDEYSVSFEGTPQMTICQFSKGDKVVHAQKPSPADYYIGDYATLDQLPDGGFSYPHHGAFYLTLQDNLPIIDQPFGVFNDCENASLMGIFVREDEEYIKYLMTARLDYIPFGYAIETKTPSCFYKVTADENCAPRMVGVRYNVVRMERELYIQGACYKPCTSLTQM